MATIQEIAGLREIVQRDKVSYEVWPEWAPQTCGRKEHVGFHLELYATHGPGTHPAAGCALCAALHADLRQIAEWIVPREQRDSGYDLLPFDGALHFWKPENDPGSVCADLLILHKSGYARPLDDCESRCLREMEARLQSLGAPRGPRGSAPPVGAQTSSLLSSYAPTKQGESFVPEAVQEGSARAEPIQSKEKTVMRKCWMFLLFIAVSLIMPAFAQAQAGTALHKGKRGDVAVTKTLRMGGVTLEPGEYTVQHRTSGSDHFIRFLKWETVTNPAEDYPQMVPGQTGVVKCEVKPAGQTFKETKVYTETKGKDTWVTKIEVKGENVVHIIPTE